MLAARTKDLQGLCHTEDSAAGLTIRPDEIHKRKKVVFQDERKIYPVVN